MNILAEKGVLDREKIGPVNVYRPAVTRGDVARAETRTLVSRMFEGSFGALATYLVDSGELSRKELDELRALIEERRQSEGRRPDVNPLIHLAETWWPLYAVHMVEVSLFIFAGMGRGPVADTGNAVAIRALSAGAGEGVCTAGSGYSNTRISRFSSNSRIG